MGRIAVYSLLPVTDSICGAIRKELGESEIVRRAREGGYRSLRESALEVVACGITSIDEAERVVGLLDEEHEEGSWEESQGSSPRASVEHAESASSKIGKRKLLLVEDDADTRNVLRLLFEKHMFEVDEAASIIFEEL